MNLKDPYKEDIRAQVLIRGTPVYGISDYRCDDGHHGLSVQHCQVPTPTSQKQKVD